MLEAVYALWKVPSLLPAFVLKGGEVSRYVLGGADLMFPGIDIPAEGLPTFAAGEPWAVKVPGNAAPIAVSSTCMFLHAHDCLRLWMLLNSVSVSILY